MPVALMLSPLQLAQLVPFVPIMLAWLRHSDPKTAADLLLAALTSMDGVQNAMRELLNTVSYNNGDLTNTQARYILNCHSPFTWAAAIRVIMQESEPRVIPNEVGGALIAALSRIHDAGDDADEVARILGHLLDQIPRTAYNTVAEFCALIRDTSSDQSQMAVLFGPMLLAPRVGMVPSNTASAAAAIMDFLIMEAETIFGRVAGYCRKDAMGVRKAMPQLPPRRMSRQLIGGGVSNSPASPPMPLSPRGGGGGVAPPPGLGGPSSGSEPRDIEVDMKKARDTKRRDQLRAFFQIRANDRVKDLSDIVDMLFENHDFEDIAKGIWMRYHMLPPGWQHDLTDVRNQGSTKLDWFEEALTTLQRAKGGRVSIAPLLRQNSQNSNATKNDLIINEIIDTEETYRDNLAELVELFINPVREIAQEKKGKEAAEELGVTPSEIERIFGWRIGEIVKVSATLQKKLEVLNICRGPVHSPLGREGIVAEAFLEIANDLHVYAPYVSAHKTSLQFLDKAIEMCSNKGEKKGMFGAGLLRGKEKEAMSFVKMWEIVSQSSSRLKGQSIASLLIMPIQRVPRYMLLLKELSKSMPETHPSAPLLKEALEKVGEQAKQINEALRQHEKLEKFFGQEDMLSPMSSEGGRGGKIKQGYVDA